MFGCFKHSKAQVGADFWYHRLAIWRKTIEPYCSWYVNFSPDFINLFFSDFTFILVYFWIVNQKQVICGKRKHRREKSHKMIFFQNWILKNFCFITFFCRIVYKDISFSRNIFTIMEHFHRIFLSDYYSFRFEDWGAD